MADSVCGRFGLWSFRFVDVSVCGHSVCGHFGLWPFRFVDFSVLAVSVCGRYDQKPYELTRGTHVYSLYTSIEMFSIQLALFAQHQTITWTKIGVLPICPWGKKALMKLQYCFKHFHFKDSTWNYNHQSAVLSKTEILGGPTDQPRWIAGWSVLSLTGSYIQCGRKWQCNRNAVLCHSFQPIP